MATSNLSTLDGWCTSQLKIVLLGGRDSGKNAVGNLILGKEEFGTKERTLCSSRIGEVAGLRLTVVNAPGWWCDFSAQSTPKLVKREIITSVALCSPGPHVFLIIIKATSVFSEKRRRALEEHMALLGDTVWSHCMVVFTCAEKYKDKNPEEYVERRGKALRWLSEKCSQRCHSVVPSDNSERTVLLAKIQKLVTENGNSVFEMQEKILRVNQEEKRVMEERTRLRLMKMRKQRENKSKGVTNIRIVLLGAKGSGKTSALNTILARENNPKPIRTVRCQAGQEMVLGRLVTVVDTPGWWMNYFCDESSNFDRGELALSSYFCPPGPHVFLLVIRVDRAFTETYRRAAQEHLDMIGEHIWTHVILLFSFGDWLGDTPIEQYIESEGEALRWIVARCGNRYHVLNSKMKDKEFQVRELIAKIEKIITSCDNGCYYKLERKVLDQLEGTMRREKERARERLMKKKKQRQMARSQLENLEPLTELRVVLIGGPKTGKSSCGNTILSRDCFDTAAQTTSCTERQGNICGKMVVVADTPGCLSVTSDFLKASCAILLVVNLSSSFKDTWRKTLEKELEAGGDQLWSRCMVLFSYGDMLGDTSIEQHIESEGEPLQWLVEKCENRYHVLDNKNWGDGAQVKELIDLMEEMLVDEALLHRGDHMWKSVASAQEQQIGTEPLYKRAPEDFMRSRPEQSNNLPESLPYPSLNLSEDHSQLVVLPAGRTIELAGCIIVDQYRFMSYIFSLLSGKQVLRLPKVAQHVPSPAPHNHPRVNSESLMDPIPRRLETTHLVSSQTQNEACIEQDLISVQSLCHPALIEQTLRRVSESGGLQTFIDQWGNSSLEELEAFIDLHFEIVWEEAMRSCQLPEPSHAVPKQDNAFGEAGEEVFASIHRKLSKLELLEEIKRDLAEQRKCVEQIWRIIQQLAYEITQGRNNTRQ
ncbi:unnamed protein product [Oreochromis niloticus]|nr:unnamed protein product [Mustela putorius furo]